MNYVVRRINQTQGRWFVDSFYRMSVKLPQPQPQPQPHPRMRTKTQTCQRTLITTQVRAALSHVYVLTYQNIITNIL
jgi:hypothetical protein